MRNRSLPNLKRLWNDFPKALAFSSQPISAKMHFTVASKLYQLAMTLCSHFRLISGSTSRCALTRGSRSGTSSAKRDDSRARFKNGSKWKKQCRLTKPRECQGSSNRRYVSTAPGSTDSENWLLWGYKSTREWREAASVIVYLCRDSFIMT